MRVIKEIVKQLKRIADSLIMIEVTLLKINELNTRILKNTQKNYNESSHEIAKTMEGEE